MLPVFLRKRLIGEVDAATLREHSSGSILQAIAAFLNISSGTEIMAAIDNRVAWSS
jgi:hypothetical protein